MLNTLLLLSKLESSNKRLLRESLMLLISENNDTQMVVNENIIKIANAPSLDTYKFRFNIFAYISLIFFLIRLITTLSLFRQTFETIMNWIRNKSAAFQFPNN